MKGEYDKLAAKLIEFIITSGGNLFSSLTKALLPCKLAHEAYGAAIGVTCGNAGIINRLFGYIYVLALNMLFVAFLYLSLFNLSFIQGILIHQAQGGENDDTSDID